MRPAQKNNPRWRFWIVREQADFTYEAAHLSIRSWSFDCYRFTEANPFRRFFSSLKKGKVHLQVYQTRRNLARTAASAAAIVVMEAVAPRLWKSGRPRATLVRRFLPTMLWEVSHD